MIAKNMSDIISPGNPVIDKITIPKRITQQDINQRLNLILSDD